MGLGFSKNTNNILGGNENIFNNVRELKNVENKLVEFLNSTGFISSGIQDFSNYIKQTSSDTDSSQKDFNASGNADAITGIKDYMSDGLNMKNISNLSDTQVLDAGYGLLNNINKSTLHFMDEDKAMLHYNINEIGNMHGKLSNSINTLKNSNNFNNNNAINLLNKTTNMLEQQKNYMTIIKDSNELSSLHSKFNSNLNNKSNYDNSPIGKNILNYMNNVTQTASNLHDYRGIRKLYDDDKINLNTGSIKEMKRLSHDLNDNMSFNDVSNYVTKLYDSIDNNKNVIHGGGGANTTLKNRLLLNKGWDSSSTVKSILSTANYTGGNTDYQLKSLNFTNTNENNYDGGVTLQNKLRSKLSISNSSRNNELVKNANILSEKLNSVSTDLLLIVPILKTLDNVQLNDLEKIFKKFLYFSSFKHKNMYLILLDFFVDMQSSYIKQDFILKINNLITLMEMGSSISSKLTSVGSKLSDVVNFINKASTEYNTKYSLTKGNYSDLNKVDTNLDNSDPSKQSNRQPLSTYDVYDSKITVDYDEIPDLTIVNTVISQTVFRLLYSIRLSIYFKQLSLSTDNHSKEYEELVGKSIGSEIDKIKQDYTVIMNKINEFEHNGHSVEFKEDKSLELNFPITVIPVPINVTGNDVKYEYVEIKKIFMYLPTNPPISEHENNSRDHRAWGRADPTWVDDETLRGTQLINDPIAGESLRSMLTNYKEFFTNYYESVIGLYMASQAIDVYLMQFTEKIKKTPELIEKLDTLLSSSKIASMIHSNKSLDKLVNVFDPNNYHVPVNHPYNEDIDKWATLNTTTTESSFSVSNENRLNNPTLFHHYFKPYATVNVPSSTNEIYTNYVDGNIIDNTELLNNDVHFRKSSILKCGAGACDELRPMIDLVSNRVPDNQLNRGGLHNRHWSTVPGKLDGLGKIIEKYSVASNVSADINENIEHKKDEILFHSLGSEYFEKFKTDSQNRRPSSKMKELKDFHKNNTTLMNILSLFFSMLGIDDNSNTILSPKTIQEYLTNFMCWGSYTLTNVPSTVDINIGNGVPLSNDNNEYIKLETDSMQFSSGAGRDVGMAIYSYFSSIDLSELTLEQQYDYLFNYDDAIINTLIARKVNVNNTENPLFISLDNADGNIPVNTPRPVLDDPQWPQSYVRTPQYMDVGGAGGAPLLYVRRKQSIYTGKHMNNITMNKLIQAMSLMKRGIPRGIVYRLNNRQVYNRLENEMFKVIDVTYDSRTLANANNPLLVGINDNLSVFNKNYTAMNVFDTNIRVTLIHSNQLSEGIGSKYTNTLQYKSQNLYSNVIKSIIGKILTVIGLYDLNDFKNNKPWRTYIMDTTRLTLGGAISDQSIIRNEIIEYYIRIPLLLKFYKTIFYDISQDDTSLKSKIMDSTNESVKILPEFEYPFDDLIKHYFIFSNDSTGSNDIVLNTTFNKKMYYNVNKVYDHFAKDNNKGNLLNHIAQQLVKEMNQKYGLLFSSDLNMYKSRISKHFGMDTDYVASLYDNNSASLLYDDDNVLIDTSEAPQNLPSQKYTKVKDAYKSDSSSTFNNFSAKSYYDNIYDFRKFIQSILTDSINDKHFSEKYNLYSSFFDIDEYMNDIKNELKSNNMTDNEKIIFISSATHSEKTSVNNSESNKKQLLFDFVITPLKQIDNLCNYLAHLRAIFSNEIINKDIKHSINAPNNFSSTVDHSQNRQSFVLPSNSQLLYNLSNSTNMAINSESTYGMAALYGFIPAPNDDDIGNIIKSYVPFNEILVPHPLNHEYNYGNTFLPYDTVTKTMNNWEYKLAPGYFGQNGNDVIIDQSNVMDVAYMNQLPFKPILNADQGAYRNQRLLGTPWPPVPAVGPLPPREVINPLRNDPLISSITYNKGKNETAFLIQNMLYIDSQYHNQLPLYDDANNETDNPSYGLLADIGKSVTMPGNIDVFIADQNNRLRTGRRKSDGQLLGPGGIYNDNTIELYPLKWSEISTTNLRLIACWCPEDLAPNRLGLHEYPYIKSGHLQSRAYNSTYSSTEYLISKLLKSCDLFDINSTPNVQSTFNVLGNVSISFNKIDTLIKEQIYNVTKILNEFKTYILSEYIHPCEFYLRSINSQYNSLFVSGAKDDNGNNQKTTMYDIQGRLNRFMSGSLTSADITTNARNKSITLEIKKEELLYLDPCETSVTTPLMLKRYDTDPTNASDLLTKLNKMGARLITKLINPLAFKNANSYIYNPKRLAYLPHQKLTSPLNTVDDKYYGKLSMEFFSDIQGGNPNSHVHMIKTTDILYSEPNPNHCNFYFTNIINSVNHIIGTLLKAGSNSRDKKIYRKIVDMFKNHDGILSSTIDTRFDSIEHINYLGDYGRTGHGTFFDKSLPFILYNKLNDNIIAYVDAQVQTLPDQNLLSYMTNYHDKERNKNSSNSFHHLSLSSIDGISFENYISSYIYKPPDINPNIVQNVFTPAVAGPGATNLIDFDAFNYDTDIKRKHRIFKDTHEGMYPCLDSHFGRDSEYNNRASTPANIYNIGNIRAYFGFNNMPKSRDRSYGWYDIIGRPSEDGALVNICNISVFRNLNVGRARTLDQLNDGLPLRDTLTDHAIAPGSISRLNIARNYFAAVYSYGAIQPSNFIYDDIKKYDFKSVVIETYMGKAHQYTPFDSGRTVEKSTVTEIKDIAAKWVKTINDPLKFFSKLQPLGSNSPEGSYILGIVSESLHGQYAPHIISSVSNGPISMNFVGPYGVTQETYDDQHLLGRSGPPGDPGLFIQNRDLPRTTTGMNAAAQYPFRRMDGSNTIDDQGGVLTAPLAPNVGYNSGDLTQAPYGLLGVDPTINNTTAPNQLELTHIQYTKDHLRYGQAIAAYNPINLNWETYQSLQYNEKPDNSTPKYYNNLKEINFKNKNSDYFNMFYKLSYAKLLTDLSAIDSNDRLNKLRGNNNILYSLSLASAYSTPREEYYGSSLFEFRPTYLYETSISKKLYVTPFTDTLNFVIGKGDGGITRFKSIAPYDPVLSLDMGGTGYWQPTGKHPIITDGFSLLTGYLTANGARTFQSYDLFGIPNVYGIQNAVLQPRRADITRFGYMIYRDNNQREMQVFPDAYVPLEDYLKGISVLNKPERGIKEMAKTIHNVIFNKSSTKIKESDQINNAHLNDVTRGERLSSSAITKAAFIALSTCDDRMGPYNILSAVDDVSGVLPRVKTLTTPEKLVVGGADFTGNDSSQHDTLNSLSTNILAIALRNGDEPLAISFQDNDKSIENGNILLKTYATVIKNMSTNWGTNMDNKINMYENLADISPETKESISAAIPYLLHETEALITQIKLLQYYVTNNKYIEGNRNLLLLNLKQAKTIANILFQGLDSMKTDFSMKFTFGEQYSGHINAISTNPTQNIPNTSFSAELYNYLSNCNEAVIRPLGTHNVYYKLNDITKNSHSSFFKRLYAVRKLYDKHNDLTTDECPSINKSINKLNVLLDKYTRKLDKTLIENVMNTCKKIKFTPFEESNINQFVCLVNNTYTHTVYSNTQHMGDHDDTIKASISGFSKFFNVRNNNLNNTINSEENNTIINKMFNSEYLTPLNSLLFIANANKNKNNNKINTVNDILGDDTLFNNDIEFYENYSDCFDGFCDIVNRHGKHQYKENGMSTTDYKTSIYDKSQDDHYQLMVFNILDLNILPIDINALTREIPLFYIFNYSTSLDEFLSTSMEAYNTERHHNNVISKKTIHYLDTLQEYLKSISPSASDYFIYDIKNNSIDVDKTLFHNKFSHMNPQSNLINDIWKRKKFNNNNIINMKGLQVDGYNQIEFLTKFNAITNLVSNIFTATSSHKINSVNNLMDASVPYKYDYSHYSSSLYYNGIDLNIAKIPVDFYKNLSYNSRGMIGMYKNIGFVTTPAYPGILPYSAFLNNNKYNGIIDSYKTIMNFISVKNSYDLDVNSNRDTLNVSPHDVAIGNLAIMGNWQYDNVSFLGVLETNLESNYIRDTLININPNYNNAQRDLASTCIYGSRSQIMGYSNNNDIYIRQPNKTNFYRNRPNQNNELINDDKMYGSKLHHIYLNSFVKHNQYNCMFNIKNIDNKYGILYTNTNQVNIIQNNAITLTNAYIPDAANNRTPTSHEICNPGFETNLCKNWLKLNSSDVTQYVENNNANGLGVSITAQRLLSDSLAINITPNPCFFNNILVPGDKHELFKEMPYTTFYNMSCLLSAVDETHISSITKLQKIENADFMMRQLKKWISNGNEDYLKAIRLRSMTSWGISDPRSLGFLGDQETLYKKIIYNSRFPYPRLHRRDRNAAVDTMMPVPVVGGANYQDLPYKSFMCVNRSPINFNEYNTINSMNDDLQTTNTKYVLKYKFLPNVNNISSDWMECNKSSKLHTSNKWLRIKSKTMFNHVLPTSDVMDYSIYKESYGTNRYLDANVNSFNANRNNVVNVGPPNSPQGEDSLHYPKSCPLGISLLKQNDKNGVFIRSGGAVTGGICASDLSAVNFVEHENGTYRNIHVLSHIMYSDKAFGYVPLRQLMLLDLGYNFIRYKITQENLYTTNKIISGSLLYDSEYHNERVYEDAYGIKGSESMSKKTSIVPRVTTIDNSKRPGL
jgi:hypothetical protein